MSGDLNQLINQATPFAPVNAEDAADRLQKAAPPEGKHPAPSPYSANPQEEVDPHRRVSTRVFVPISPPVGGADSGEVSYELRELSQGSAGLAVYTSAEKMFQVLGLDQPHIEIEVIELLRRIAGRVPIVVDAVLRSAGD
ncbi:hypothetical protein [Actinomadura nitritigenes]|uniref:hypothetical protein n=1 Tax=Actinomadura nitritigenes TaxID=134602 RepID=UPI003D920853